MILTLALSSFEKFGKKINTLMRNFFSREMPVNDGDIVLYRIDKVGFRVVNEDVLILTLIPER